MKYYVKDAHPEEAKLYYNIRLDFTKTVKTLTNKRNWILSIYEKTKQYISLKVDIVTWNKMLFLTMQIL